VSKAKSWLEGYGEDQRENLIPEEPRPQRARKDTRHWCKGKVGREHTPELVVHHAYTSILMRCHDSTWMPTRWMCRHALRCTTCGKYTKTWLSREECPTWLASQDETPRKA
jgi:hypothetical protein